MSWDVAILKEKFDLNDQDYLPSPLGNRSEIVKELCALLPGLDFSDPSWGRYEGNGFSIEFSTGDDESVNTIMLHVRGGGDPMPVITLILLEQKWEAMDCSTGEFMDCKNMDDTSWVEFQKFRDKIIDRG
ncbi:MAG: hypothetical protein KDD41_12750 [Flavobacteriales bacterium]|nr:hypothetical protein [Flavobacteriales bacterium]